MNLNISLEYYFTIINIVQKIVVAMSKLLKNLWLILPLLLIFSPFLVLIFYREDDAIKPNEVLTSEVSANADNCINFTTTNTANHNYTYSAYDYSESRYIFLNSVTSKRSSFFGKKRVLKKEAKIVGGTIADDNDYPFYVKLYYDEDHYCGGSLINSVPNFEENSCFPVSLTF
ncbi:unnamed protein product [Oikopleura dioica]|uniref:Uncharacterized protein n=1 Tax=Oikopleura dioica TaxID=34765 RepID=E4YRL1_OIKDI|nr:unnamed protein product [Oikopleura dioica]